ncbi:MAG: 16S rRNA (adenine(1518)-N(6)/adenine(1519)-N(6))-dimethyltransferase RsmA [Acetobacteraceae bacterium]
MEQHGLSPRKSLGQHFLLDPSIVARIAQLAGQLDGVTVVEVGPGPGGLTRALLRTEAAQIFTVEIDPRAIPILKDLKAYEPNRLHIIQADALRQDMAAFGTAPRQLVANLPYNVGTKLLVNSLAQAAMWRRMTLMFQREVADRICAQAGTAAYGRLSVLAQFCASCSIVMHVPAGAFTPPPKIDSAVVDIRPHAEQPSAALFLAMGRVTAAFGQRRKMLRSALKTLHGETLLDRTGIDPSRRAETLSVAEFTQLATLLRDIESEAA